MPLHNTQLPEWAHWLQLQAPHPDMRQSHGAPAKELANKQNEEIQAQLPGLLSPLNPRQLLNVVAWQQGGLLHSGHRDGVLCSPHNSPPALLLGPGHTQVPAPALHRHQVLIKVGWCNGGFLKEEMHVALQQRPVQVCLLHSSGFQEPAPPLQLIAVSPACGGSQGGKLEVCYTQAGALAGGRAGGFFTHCRLGPQSPNGVCIPKIQ